MVDCFNILTELVSFEKVELRKHFQSSTFNSACSMLSFYFFVGFDLAIHC